MADSTDSTELAQERTDWAEDRTDWAEDRTILANERTFAGWMRTGMACVALALGLKAVFGDFEPTWVAKAVAEIFIGIALLIFWAARRKSRATREKLNDHAVNPIATVNMDLISGALAVGAVATGGVLLWL